MRLILGLVLLAAVAAGAYVALGLDPPDPADSAESEARASAAAERKGPHLQGVREGTGSSDLAAHAGRCQVQGKVQEAGRPVEGAAVDVRLVAGREALDPLGGAPTAMWWRQHFALPPEPGPVSARSTTSADGSFRVEGLAPGVYQVRATKGTSRGERNVGMPEDGARVNTTIELLPRDLALAGRVTWSDGQPFAGTLVLTPTSSERGQLWSGFVPAPGQVAHELDAEGRFQVLGLGAGVWGVRAVVPGRLWVAGSPVTLPSAGPYEWVIPRGTERLSGRVVDALSDAPLVGATLFVSTGLQRGQATLQIAADADGRFSAEGLMYPASVTAECPGYSTYTKPVPKAEGDVVLRLVRVARIAGRVTTPAGAPAPGAVVVAASTGGSGGWWNQRIRAVADRDGRYALDAVPAGSPMVFVRGGGWVSPELPDAQGDGYNPLTTALASGAALTLDLLAVPAARIVGRTVDPSGTPVAGAVVKSQPQSSGGMRNDWAIVQALGTDAAVSDADGAYLLDSLVPGFAVTLTAEAPEQPQAVSGPHAPSAQTPTTVDLRFPLARWLDVTVRVEAEDVPVPGARLTLVQRRAEHGGGWSDVGTTALTDATGQARLGPCGEGELGVRVQAEGLAQQNQPSFAEGSKDGPGPFALLVQLPRGLSITGKVLRADGSAVAQAQMSAHSEGNNRRFGSNVLMSGTDGSFTLTGLAAGTYSVRAVVTQGTTTQTARTTAAAGAKDVVLTLAEGASDGQGIVVRVVDERGEPVRSGQVSLSSKGSSTSTGFNEGQARFSVEEGSSSWIAQGYKQKSLYLDVYGARGADGQLLDLAPARVGPLTEDQKQVEVKMVAGRGISGRVLTADGLPLRGVLVRARAQEVADQDGQGRQNTPGEGRSDATGAFTVRGLGEGNHLLEVSQPPDCLPSAPIEAPAGAKDVEIRLQRGASARVRVVDAAGLPVARATVSAAPMPPENATREQQQEFYRRANRPGGHLQTQTTADGVAALRGLDPDVAYALNVQPPGARGDVKAWSNQRWKPADTEVQLEPGYFVSGIVKDVDGKPLQGAQVWHKSGDQGWNGVGTGQDGKFRIVGLAPGSVRLRATPPSNGHVNPEDASISEVSVPVGRENVVLTVDRGAELVVRVTGLDEGRQRGSHLNAMLLKLVQDRWEQAGWGWGQVSEGAVRIAFQGLRADVRYAVWVQPQPGDEHYAYATDLKPGAGEVALRAQRGGSIRGRLSTPQGGRNAQVNASNDLGMSVQGVIDADGRYEIKGLPEGAWRLSAHAEIDGSWGSTSGEARTGGSLDLVIEPRTNSK